MVSGDGEAGFTDGDRRAEVLRDVGASRQASDGTGVLVGGTRSFECPRDERPCFRREREAGIEGRKR